MIVLLCLVPARMQEPLSKFLVSPWEQKGEGDPPLWSVRSHVPSPLISRRVSPFPLALSSRSSSYGVRLRCTTLSRAFSPRQSSIGIVQSPDHPHALAHPTVEIKSSEITISYSGRPLSNNGRSTHVSSEPLCSEWVSGFLTCSDGAPERAYTYPLWAESGPSAQHASPVAIVAFGTDVDEFDESEVWGCPVEPHRTELSMPVPSPACKKSDHEGGDRTAASSLPKDILDWPKILGHCTDGSHSSTRGWWAEQADDDDVTSCCGGAGRPRSPSMRESVGPSRAATSAGFAMPSGIRSVSRIDI
ncbi:hypothetical protein GW17_00026373 [Ensete ventricosum]|nr:hypothetical protein GW17_00026373 [Ensete ventricosum]